MTRFVLTMTGLLLATTVAHAQAAAPAITTSQECFKAVDTLAQAWENHKYASKAESDKIGASLKQLEAQCEANQLAAAQKAAGDLKAEIAH